MRHRAILDHPSIRSRPAVRKAIVLLGEPLARVERLAISDAAFQTRPPVVVNSLPKSGTHLLLQITRNLPGVRYRGRFVATSPSVTQKERSPQELAHRVRRILPGETVGAHLHHSAPVSNALDAINAVSLFIYRDPRAVIVSEAHYLADMNRWHRMHKVFRELPTLSDRVRLALKGYDDRYPDANARFLPYAGWLSEEHTVSVRYEDLRGTHRAREVDRIIAAWRRASGGRVEVPEGLPETLLAAVDPAKSHTFRSGGIANWQIDLSPELIDEMTARLAPSLAAFGYDP